MKFKSYEKFISYLKGLSSDRERMQAIMDYLLENASYNYTVLEWCKIEKNDELLNKIYAIDQTYDVNNPVERAQALIYAKNELGLSQNLIDFISKNYGKRYLIPAKAESFAFGKVIPAEPKKTGTYNFTQAMQLMSSLAAIYENGLITKGVCKDFEEFISNVCAELGIKSKRIKGKTNVGHQWNETEVDGQKLVYDITYAMFAKDHFANWGEKTTPSDWLGVPYSNILSM